MAAMAAAMAARMPKTMVAMASSTASIRSEVAPATITTPQKLDAISNEVIRLSADSHSTRKTIPPRIAETAMRRTRRLVDWDRVVVSTGGFMIGLIQRVCYLTRDADKRSRTNLRR